MSSSSSCQLDSRESDAARPGIFPRFVGRRKPRQDSPRFSVAVGAGDASLNGEGEHMMPNRMDSTLSHGMGKLKLTRPIARACVVVLDAAHARLFSYERDGKAGSTLREERQLSQDGRRNHGKFSDSKPGNRWQEGGRGSTDDHRTAQIAEHDEKFVKRVLGEVAQHVQGGGFGSVIVVASPKTLGMVRSNAHAISAGVAITELAQDLPWMTPPQLHDHLAAKQLIDPRPRMPPRPSPGRPTGRARL